MSAASIISVRSLVYHYEESIPALNGIDLEIPDRTYLAIVGQNGSGKTTLAKHLNGLLRPTSGYVRIDGVDTTQVPLGLLARTVGYVFQNPDHQIFSATTREEISFGLRNLGLPPEVVRARTAQALEAFDLSAYADVPPAVLGYGLRRKVSIAAVFAMFPRILVLDEPTVGLDWRSAQELLALVRDMHAHGHTVVLVTHDMRVVAENAEQMLVLHEGHVLTYGLTALVFARAEELRRAQILPPQITQLGQRLGDTGLPADLLTVAEFADAFARLQGIVQ